MSLKLPDIRNSLVEDVYEKPWRAAMKFLYKSNLRSSSIMPPPLRKHIVTSTMCPERAALLRRFHYKSVL